MTDLQKRTEEVIEQFKETKDRNNNPAVFHEISFRDGVKFCLSALAAQSGETEVDEAAILKWWRESFHTAELKTPEEYMLEGARYQFEKDKSTMAALRAENEKIFESRQYWEAQAEAAQKSIEEWHDVVREKDRRIAETEACLSQAIDKNMILTDMKITAFKLASEMDCECGYETGSEESWKNPLCSRCEIMEALTNKGGTYETK